MDKPKPDNPIFEQLTETYLLALCIWAEARNQGLEGMQAVGSVILNRASHPGWWGKDVKSIILAPCQFSCFNADNPATPRNEEDPERAVLLKMADRFLDSMLRDSYLRAAVWVAAGLLGSPSIAMGWTGKYITSNVGAATHYHTSAVAPDWKFNKNMKLVCRIKDHLFYEEVKIK